MSNSVSTHLMFFGAASEAMEWKVTKMHNIGRLSGKPVTRLLSGNVDLFFRTLEVYDEYRIPNLCAWKP